MKFVVLPLIAKIKASDALAVLAVSIISAVTTSFFIGKIVYQAALVATPPMRVYGKLIVTDSLEELAETSVNPSIVSSEFVALLLKLYLDNFWVFAVIVSVFATVALYPIIARIYAQLPVLMYRVKLAPLDLTVSIVIISLIAGLPITLQPLLLLLLILYRFNLFSYIITQKLLQCIIINSMLTILPATASLTYISTGRHDLTVTILLFTALTLHALAAYGYALFSPLILTSTLLLVYINHRTRWHDIKHGA